MIKTSFNEKLALVNNAIVKQLEVEGQQTVGLEDKILEIAKGYMLVEQCLWYRLKDDKAITNLLVKFESITQKALPLIATHGFENLVFTFRSVYTNLYQVSGGKGRKYQLSLKVYEEFINNVDSGSQVVLVKQAKTTKKPKALKQPQVVNNFMSNLLKQVAPTTKVVTPKAANVQPKVEKKVVASKEAKVVKEMTYPPKVEAKKTKTTSKEVKATKSTTLIIPHDDKFLLNLQQPQEAKAAKTTTKGSWVEHDIQKSLQENTFIKVLLIDDTKAFGRFKYVSYLSDGKGKQLNNIVVVTMNIKGKPFDIELKNIAKVYTYVK